MHQRAADQAANTKLWVVSEALVELFASPGGPRQLLQPGIDVGVELNRRAHGRGWCLGLKVGLTTAKPSGHLIAAGGSDGRVPACVDPADPIAG